MSYCLKKSLFLFTTLLLSFNLHASQVLMNPSLLDLGGFDLFTDSPVEVITLTNTGSTLKNRAMIFGEASIRSSVDEEIIISGTTQVYGLTN